jgi:diacylglycerol kinase (ATP)
MAGGQGITDIKRIVRATVASIAGVRAAWRHEAAFRQECTLAVILVPVAFWIADATIELVLLLGSILVVLIVELLNSAVEATVDRIGTDFHELSGRAKDLASAAVFVSLTLAAVTWVLIAWSPVTG